MSPDPAERATAEPGADADVVARSPDRATSPADATAAEKPSITLAEFQELIRRMYLPKDVARGVDGTFMWLVEEIGELAAALRDGTHQERAAEFADVLAWLTTIANVSGVDLTAAVVEKYGSGCPGCGRFVCTCPDAGKP
jgi:NTP pyrophosphatase (non-canonical NTP hydrolase)